MKLSDIAILATISLIAVTVFGKPTVTKDPINTKQILLDSIGNKKWACLYGKPGSDAGKNIQLADPHAFVEIHDVDAVTLKIDITTGDGELTSSFYGEISETESPVKVEVKRHNVTENIVQNTDPSSSSASPHNSVYRVAPVARQWFIQTNGNQSFQLTINKSFTPSGTLTCQDV
ncbi:hypothetical protein [Sulfurirhabdus autotrophica]|nr:hypothetical protein [Sulfurirhabdus autotrophica]